VIDSGGPEGQKLEPDTKRFTGFVSFIGYYRVKLTSKKFELFELLVLGRKNKGIEDVAISGLCPVVQ
jgi:hypothetical protein